LEGEQAGARYVLEAPRQTPFGTTGARLGHRTGSSLEFMDHREYQAGDDLRRIDWSAYARSDKLTIKLYREEITPHLDIVIDGSRSMALENTAKAEATLGLAAVFATAAANADFSHRSWIAGEVCHRVGNGNDSPSVWDGIDFDYRGSPAESFGPGRGGTPTWRPRGIRVFLSDLLWLGDPLLTVRQLAEGATAAVVVQVLAEADVNPAERGNLRLVDSETEEVHEIFLDAVAERRYRDALSRHQQNWHRASKEVGGVMTTVVAERVIRDWNLEELVAAEILKVA
jgi:uncharacterized protein (DUF58 family)